MSGGHFSYTDSQLKYEIFGFSDAWNNALEDREISELVWDVLELIHEYDWYASGDTCKDTYLAAKDEFKNKWFKTDRNTRIRYTIDKTFEDAKAELYETFAMNPTMKLILPEEDPYEEYEL